MTDATTGGTSAPKPSSSVKLVLLGEAAVGKVRQDTHFIPICPTTPRRLDSTLSCLLYDSFTDIDIPTKAFLECVGRRPSISQSSGERPRLTSAVRQSSLVLRFVNNDFQENKEPTIGAAFLTQKISLPNRIIKFEIWDTAGQERFASLAPMYYRNAQAALVVYDLTKPTSLIKAKHWVAELQRQASPGIVIALVGNKLDLCADTEGNDMEGTGEEGDGESGVEENLDGAQNVEPNARRVSTREAKAYAEDESLLFFETSAKTGSNVTEVFTAIANAIPESNLKGGRAGGAGAGGATQAALSGAAGRAEEARVNLGERSQMAKDNCAC